MGIVKATLTRVRGLMKESDGKALQNPELRAEGRGLQEEGRAESTTAQEQRGQRRGAR